MKWLTSLPARVTGFVVGTALVWGGYYYWRPPAPMLFLKHIEHLGRDSNEVSITLDDAPHPLTTPLLLASLKGADVKATWFVVGDGLRLYPELSHRILTEGHTLANHSQPHHNLTKVDPTQYTAHVDAGFEAIEKAGIQSGVPQKTKLFRPPGGGLNRDLMAHLYERDYTLAWWTNNPGDWTCPPAWKIATTVEANLRPGDILLMHDGGTGTPQAIPAVVKAARRQGLEFVVMPESKPAGD